ncbi:hypothetical protein [Rhizobium sp. AAP43]|nr:hypothetical protein [Rhizobium sp. AAP43]KPF41078.1 hypothetical protein IP76_22690 [Rhizobium sp. AAP43]
MTRPNRTALLALCLLAAAAGAAAAGTCTAVDFKLDLVDATGHTSDPIAKCLSSFNVHIDGTCGVTIEPLASSDNYVPAMWGTNSIGLLKECPYDTGAADTSATSDLDVDAAIAAALNVFVYGSQVTGATVDAFSTTATPGVYTVDRSSAAVLTYAVTESSDPVRDVATCSGSDTTICKTDLATKCALGAYGVTTVDGVKICALCPAGTYSDDGVGCSPCDAGTSLGTVGGTAAGQCTNCVAGSYAQGGNSDCLLCPAGQYQDTAAQGTCKVCESNKWSLFPGMTQCLACVSGVPSASGTPSPGYHLLSISDANTLKSGCSATYKPTLTTNCSMSNTLLSVFVDYDCSVIITPIFDELCSEPGSTAYNYNDLAIQGAYIDSTNIRTMLPTASTGQYASSYMLSLFADSGKVNATFSGVTVDAAQAGTVGTASCAGQFQVTGGELIGIDSGNSGATCPAGTYSISSPVEQYCPPCPTGYTCTGGAKTTCGYDKYNSFLGKSDNAADCDTCDALAVPRYTSLPGADYCTVPYVNITCGDGLEYDDSSSTCVPCADGWKRLASIDDVCVACTAGTYKLNATHCTACTGNTVAPVDAMNSCQTCPLGSIADGTFTECTPCGPGTYSDGTACQPCDDGKFRSGDATPENNECKPIPAGYREKLVSGEGAAAAKSEIVLCEIGTYSAWSSGTRDPATSTECATCTLNTYAPRKGMQKCVACKAGTIPDQSASTTDIKGPDRCVACSATSYRAAFMASATCTTCPAGSETGPSNHAACTPCRPGYVSDGSAADCTPCGAHKFMSMSGQQTCQSCPKGYEGVADANTATVACTPCAKGYYNNQLATACGAAPVGTYVNTTGATAYTPCPYGTFSAEAGSDTCDACPPGQYTNTLGSKSCKTCPSGTFSSGRASTCQSCKAGYYAAAGSSVCSPCKPGYYSSAPRAGSCLLCPIGKQCPLSATAVPQTCGKGYFSSTEGARLCTPCPVNTYQPGTSPTQCVRCADGYNTRGLTGQSRCQVVRSRPLRLAMF